MSVILKENPPNVSVAQRLLELRDVNLDNVSLPENPLSLIDFNTAPEALFRRAEQAFYETGFFYVEEYLRILKTSVNQEDRSVAIEKLSKYRRIAHIYRSAWQLFSQDHNCPTSIYDFVKSIGKIKKYFTNSQEGTNQLVENILKAETELEEIQKDEDFNNFQPADTYSFQEYVSSIRDMLVQSISGETCTRKEFHTIRKKGVRLLMNIFQLNLVERSDPKIFETFRYLKKLDSMINDIHDQHELEEVQAEQNGDIIDLKETQIEIPTKIRIMIEELVSQI